MRDLKLPLLCLCILFFCGCGASAIKLVKSSNFTLEKYKKLAVMDFEGNDPDQAKALAEAFVPCLMDVGFDVIERSALEKIMKEQKLGMSGVIDTDTIHQVGKLTGVDGIVFGSFHISKKQNRSSFTLFRPARWYQPRGAATFTNNSVVVVFDNVSIRIVDVETGRIVLSESSEETVSSDDIEGLLENMQNKIKDSFRQQ